MTRQRKLHRRPEVQFVAATAVFAAVWLFGLTLRTGLWKVDVEWVRRSGISGMLRGGASDMVSVALVLLVAISMYLLALLALRKEFPHRYAFALGGSIVMALAALPTAPLSSPDTTHFAADVRTLWLYGRWPGNFENVPNKVDDPVAKEVRTFAASPSGYGVVAYAVGGIPVPFVGDGLRANVFGQKVLSGTMLILTAVAAAAVAKRLGRNPALALAAIAMNPMFIWQFPGDGHNDAIMAALGTASLLFLVRKEWKHRGAGALIAFAAVMTKYSIVVVAPVVVAAWFPKYRRTLGALVAVGGIAALVLFLGVVRPGISTIGPLEGVTRNTPWSFLFNGLDLEGGPHHVAIAVCYSGAVLVIAAVILYHRLETEQDVIDAMALTLALFLFFFAPTLRQWYIIWAFPLVMLSSRKWLRDGAIAFSLCGFMPVIAANWNRTIDTQIGIPHPIGISVILVWVTTIAVGYIQWTRFQPGRPASARSARPARRAAAGQRKRSAAR